MKCLFVLLCCAIASVSTYAQPKHPDSFLNYRLGDRYTPHFRIVEYFKHVAEAVPGMVKLEEYGRTNEGRPLVLAYVASRENMQRLEQIRLNNLQLANMIQRSPSIDNMPAIVWLSYNVHGNETSSSEAAMLTLYELINPSNERTRQWLRNTLIIIDPCMNPDGRDRYVNWFNSVVGQEPNPQPFSREHIEPWPGGRSNHYYFDLNRDWAWQTQVESQQRMVKYNQWLPHVHVDYHEQGIDEPYYFAPAAEPFHEVITPWQRDFQTMIGKNNARYFDESGWLYFTKERFDLFYPSYGDTYPTYKGAIGMTYEQAGGPRGGATVINEDEDTLTLRDRLFHHYTTGMATIEITSMNADKVIREFKNYYDKARSSPPGEFKAYVVKADDGDRLRRLRLLLDRNAIEYSYPTRTQGGNLQGFNYHTGKTESVRFNPKDIVINTNQPNSNLIKVLFERSSKLSDSATYDITAWGVPYAYGLVTYGMNNYVQNVSNQPYQDTLRPSASSTAYAYAIPWTGLHSVRFLSKMLKEGIRVRYAEQPFTARGQVFDKGTLLVTRTSNSSYNTTLESLIKQAAKDAGVVYTVIESGFVEKGFDIGSDRVRTMKKPKVALVAGDQVSSLGMGEIWHFFDKEINYPVSIIWVNNLNSTTLRQVDVLILPDGNYRFLSDKEMSEDLRDWVSAGGKVIAIEGAVAQMARSDWGIKLKGEKKEEEKKEEKEVDYTLLRRYENRERDYIPNLNPGSIFKVELDNSHPLAFGYEPYYFTLKQDDQIYEFLEEGGWNVGIVRKDSYVTGFTGSKVKEKLKDGWLFSVKDMGRGQVVFMADNPMFRSFWENGKMLMANAVFMVGQ